MSYALSSPTITISETENTPRQIYIRIHNNNSVGILRATITISNPATEAVLQQFTVNTLSSSYYLQVYPALYYDVEYISIRISTYVELDDTTSLSTVAEMCENTKQHKYTGALSLQKDVPVVYLKAFCNLPGASFEPVYMYWESSTDGVTWTEVSRSESLFDTIESVPTSVFVPTVHTDSSLDNSGDGSYQLRTVWRLSATSSTDSVGTRPDILRVAATDGVLQNKLFRVTMVTLKNVAAEDTEYIEGATHTVKTILGSSAYTPVFSSKIEFLESDLYGVSNSRTLYYGSTLYSFGNPDFKNNLIASFPGESVRPLSRVTPLEISENTHITALLPWKNYIIAFTEKTVHVISPVSDGFTASTVNTFIGVPESDSNCCISTLNGVIFKSNSKVYMLYPNLYAGTDTVLNITELSTRIEDLLEAVPKSKEHFPFAIGTDSEYILMIPSVNCTYSFRYEYSKKIWTFHEYPVVFTSYTVFNVSDIRLTGYVEVGYDKIFGEYVLDAEYSQVFEVVSDNLPYADCIRKVDSLSNWADLLTLGTLKPLSFELDSGQKSDSISQTKQFVESKFNVVTLHEKDTFPMKIIVHIDGCPLVITRDVNTDSAFWKEKISHEGTLATTFVTDRSEMFNVFRQMFLRYSGKGKSIRHIVEGESVYPFKLYEIDYRYRNLNIKQ